MSEEIRRVPKTPMTNLNTLNEAYCYEKPSAFSRGMSLPSLQMNMPYSSS